MHVLVIYDVSDNKKRRRIFRILNGCGTRVQESAFECIISEEFPHLKESSQH